MVGLTQLWLPILLSAVPVFVVSSVLHMFTPWHAHDFAPLPDEDKVSDALRAFALPPGDYLVPRPGGRDAMRDAADHRGAQQLPRRAGRARTTVPRRQAAAVRRVDLVARI